MTEITKEIKKTDRDLSNMLFKDSKKVKAGSMDALRENARLLSVDNKLDNSKVKPVVNTVEDKKEVFNSGGTKMWNKINKDSMPNNIKYLGAKAIRTKFASLSNMKQNGEVVVTDTNFDNNTNVDTTDTPVVPIPQVQSPTTMEREKEEVMPKVKSRPNVLGKMNHFGNIKLDEEIDTKEVNKEQIREEVNRALNAAAKTETPEFGTSNSSIFDSVMPKVEEKPKQAVPMEEKSEKPVNDLITSIPKAPVEDELSNIHKILTSEPKVNDTKPLVTEDDEMEEVKRNLEAMKREKAQFRLAKEETQKQKEETQKQKEELEQTMAGNKELYNEIKKIKEEANKKYNEREALLNKEKDELKRERERILAEREEIRKAREKYEAENDRIRQQIAAFAEYMKEFDDDEEKAEEVGARKTV